MTNNEAELLEVVKAARPFAQFIDTPAGQNLPDHIPLTNGSNMARRQLNAADFRRLATALANLDRKNP